MSQDCAAEEIADELLYETGQALLTGTFDRFSACFGLPHLIETADGRCLLRSVDDLRERFDDLREYFRRQQVTDIVRTVVEARFLDSDTIGSTHVSRMLTATGAPLRSPYPVYSVIRRQGHLDWRVMSSLYAILDCHEHNAVLASEPLPSERSR
ncbi:hypothetical protein [Marivita geojedonensis]|uniref:SnoaL-like domain-containing protein n=1 Tax=Marivita geojedonensis TaxID=1123756 RepID=A0A1X4NBC9_9RHOB|nr:hypothetical protein [Marivita geojedonensis]OSQ43861.1 hypothetical protein MGEO_19355 [Marivita geojedonensis]PRY72510.1 hypothetical protein CLV76_13419 [Marivita geojedonensis]